MKPEIPAALAWLFDAVVIIEKAVTVGELLGWGDNDLTRNVWAISAGKLWRERRPYTSESTVPEGSSCYMCCNDKRDQLWYLPPYEYPMCIDRHACWHRQEHG